MPGNILRPGRALAQWVPVFVLLAIAAAAAAQEAPKTPPPADPADVESIDAIIAAVYDVISGPAGQKRDWKRWESLFAPDARLIPTGRRPDGPVAALTMTPMDYVERAGASLEANGFFETEVARVTESFGHIAHAFSTYESRRTAADEEPFMRGINSFQLLYDGERWWVVTVFWDSERPDNPIPEKYLKGKGNQGR